MHVVAKITLTTAVAEEDIERRL